MTKKKKKSYLAINPEGGRGGGKALMAWPLREELLIFLRLPLPVVYVVDLGVGW